VIEIPNEIVARARERDQDACRRIVEELHRPVLSTIHRFLGKRFVDDVDDVAQDVFLKVFRAIDRFDPERGVKFSTWVFTFVRNHCLDVLKKKRLTTVSLSSGGAGDDETSWELEDPSGRKPALQALDSELASQIETALHGLSDDHRMVFVLREFEQLDLKSIAEVMGCTEGTVKSRLHRAKAAMKEKLKGYLRT